jgi:hypothetical protein
MYNVIPSLDGHYNYFQPHRYFISHFGDNPYSIA